MFFDAIILIVGLILQMIYGLFQAINYAIPSQIGTAFNTFFSYARLADGIFPMSDILLAIFSVLSVWILLYVVKILLFAFSILPWIGKTVNLPSHTTTTEVNSHIDNVGERSERITVSKDTTITSVKRKRWMR